MDDDNTAPPPPVLVAPDDLSPEALRGVIEAFVLREGTEYGEREISLEVKVAQVLRQLQCGEAQILYDLVAEHATIVIASDVPRGAIR